MSKQVIVEKIIKTIKRMKLKELSRRQKGKKIDKIKAKIEQTNWIVMVVEEG